MGTGLYKLFGTVCFFSPFFHCSLQGLLLKEETISSANLFHIQKKKTSTHKQPQRQFIVDWARLGFLLFLSTLTITMEAVSYCLGTFAFVIALLKGKT